MGYGWLWLSYSYPIWIWTIFLGFRSNDATINFQGLGFRTRNKKVEDNNNNCVVELALSGVKCDRVECKRWMQSAKNEYDCACFLQSNLSNLVCTCMLWKIEHFALDHWWGVVLSRAFENFKQLEVLSIPILSALCKHFKVHSTKFDVPYQVGEASFLFFHFHVHSPFSNLFFSTIYPSSQVELSW